jgi:ribose 5-phosphate isomerase B
MTIFIGADHGGFDLKNQLVEYLQDKNIRVEDMGAYEIQPTDDFVDYARKVAEAVLQNPSEFLGILLCRSGVGMDIAANRYKGIRCMLGFDEKQIQRGRADDHTNILALASNFIDVEKAKRLVDAFLIAELKTEDKYLRRVRKLDE